MILINHAGDIRPAKRHIGSLPLYTARAKKPICHRLTGIHSLQCEPAGIMGLGRGHVAKASWSTAVMDTKEVFVAGILLALYMGTTYWVFTDVLRLPRMLEMHKAEVHRDLAGTGAFGWLVGCLVMWPLAFPAYLIYRGGLIRDNRLRYDTFHSSVTETGLPAYLRRQALINGLYLVAVAFLPQVVWSVAAATNVSFLYATGGWAGWLLFIAGLMVLGILAVERGVPGPVRKRMARALMPGFPLLVFSVLGAIFASMHLHYLLAYANHAAAAVGGFDGVWQAFVTYGWILLFWMVPAVAVVNMVTEAFAPGLAAIFTAMRAIWRDDQSSSAKVS
jgi:hypothetical protein